MARFIALLCVLYTLVGATPVHAAGKPVQATSIVSLGVVDASPPVPHLMPAGPGSYYLDYAIGTGDGFYAAFLDAKRTMVTKDGWDGDAIVLWTCDAPTSCRHLDARDAKHEADAPKVFEVVIYLR